MSRRHCARDCASGCSGGRRRVTDDATYRALLPWCRYLLMLGTMANAEQALHHTKLLKVSAALPSVPIPRAPLTSAPPDTRVRLQRVPGTTEQDGRAATAWHAQVSMFVSLVACYPHPASCRRPFLVITCRAVQLGSCATALSKRQQDHAYIGAEDSAYNLHRAAAKSQQTQGGDTGWLLGTLAPALRRRLLTCAVAPRARWYLTR